MADWLQALAGILKIRAHRINIFTLLFQPKKSLWIGRKECYVANNLIPDVGQLNTEMAENIVREVFLQRIVNMKGLDKVKEILDGILMPTPSAVLSAGEILTRGTTCESGIGELMIIDIGGATTDVHSFAEQSSYRDDRLFGS